MTRPALRILTAMLALSFMGDPVPAEVRQPASVPCAEAPSEPMSCCQPGQCHCDLSSPSQPMPNSPPVRAVNAGGHEVAKIASLPVSAAFFVSTERFSLCSTVDARTRQSTLVALYTLTHAFLI
jgi:hypothetical protein